MAGIALAKVPCIVTIDNFEDMTRLVKSWAIGHYPHIMLIGGYGTFKSTTVGKHAAERSFPIHTGATTARGLFNTFMEAEAEKLLCFDDLSIDIFNTAKGISIFQQAVNGDCEREVSYKTNIGLETAYVSARLCFITNGFGIVSTKLAAQFEAFTDRCHVFYFRPSNDEIIRRAYEIGVGHRESNAYIVSLYNTGRVPPFTMSARIMKKAGEYFLAREPKWKEFTRQLLGLESLEEDWDFDILDVEELNRTFHTMRPARAQVFQVKDAQEDDEAPRVKLYDRDNISHKNSSHKMVTEENGTRNVRPKNVRPKNVIKVTSRQLAHLGKIPVEWIGVKGVGSSDVLEDGASISVRHMQLFLERGWIERKGEWGYRMIRLTAVGKDLLARRNGPLQSSNL